MTSILKYNCVLKEVWWNSLRKYRESSGKIRAWEIQNVPFTMKNRMLNYVDLITKKGAHLFGGGCCFGF